MINGTLFGNGLAGQPLTPAGLSRLHELYTQPPFSTWNTHDGRWQARKRAWSATCGIQSEVGRDKGMTYHIPLNMSDGRDAPMGFTGVGAKGNTSIFDPVVCELVYSWWSPPGGIVVDPFCGGSVRGITAAVLGRKYWGCDLRDDQIAANRGQWRPGLGPYRPRWVVGDCRALLPDAPTADFLFSCPPYGDLERYSDDPADLSTLAYDDFIGAYEACLALAAGRLRPHRFACLVVGNFRNRDTGYMHNFMGDTIGIMRAAGLRLWNDIVLLNVVGSAGMRANTSFLRGKRKVVKLHQNILVFVKGDPGRAALACGPLTNP